MAPLVKTVGSTCGLASLVSFILNGDEVRQLLIEPYMSPSCGLEMSLINFLIFLFCLLHCSGGENKQTLDYSRYQLSFHSSSIQGRKQRPRK